MAIRPILFAAFMWLAMPVVAAPAMQRTGEVELVNPFPAGGPQDINGSMPANRALRTMQDHAVPPVTDVLASTLQQSLALALDTPVSLVRRPRRNGVDAQRYASRAAPDGRTLLLGSTGSIVIQPLVVRDPKLDPLQSLKPVALVARMPFVLITAAGPRLHNMQALVEKAKATPGRLHLGSPGEFTISHLAGALLGRAAGIVLHHVSFNGSAAAARGIVADKIDVALLPLPAVLSYARNPKLRALAITDRERHSELAGVPTLTESGVTGAAYSAWYGVFTAPATPEDIVGPIDAAIGRELQDETVRMLLSRYGLTPTHLSSERLVEIIRYEYNLWKPYIEELRVR